MTRLKLDEVPERKITLIKRLNYVPKNTIEQAIKQADDLAARTTKSLQCGLITIGEYLEQANEAVRVLSVVRADKEAAFLASKLSSVKVSRFGSEGKFDLEDESTLIGSHNYRGVLMDLAHLYIRQGKYAKAEELYREAIQQKSEAWRQSDTDNTFVLECLAWSCANQNKYIDAEVFYQAAYNMAVTKFKLDDDDFKYESFLRNLYNFYRYINQLEKAELYANLALTIAEKYSGSSSRSVAARANDLGNLYVELGRYKEAKLLFERALRIRETISVSHDTHSATLLSNLGLLSIHQGRLQEAELLFSKALAIREEMFGVDHIEVAEILKHYSELLNSLNRDDEARTMADRMRAIEANQLHITSI